jgi:hypothetical protein
VVNGDNKLRFLTRSLKTGCKKNVPRKMQHYSANGNESSGNNSQLNCGKFHFKCIA